MTVVRTTTGAARGSEADGVRSFRGIPYAASPVGALRFRLPHPPEPWSGTLEATRSAPAAPQLVPAGLPVPPNTSEDCLYVDVYTPANAEGAPVLVWLHGGGFRFGWAGDYDASHLSRRWGVVVVVVGYRLGLFGFAALDQVDSTYAGAANAGIADQAAALSWVAHNIEHFGGDPDNVTLAGQSAGGESVAALLATPTAAGTFHRAIIQSATVDLPALGDHQRGIIDRAVAALGGDVLHLLNASTEQVLVAQAAAVDQKPASYELQDPRSVDLFPCVDGTVVRAQPIEVAGSSVPLLVGSTKHEGVLLDGSIPAAEPTAEMLSASLAAAGLNPAQAEPAYRGVLGAASNRDVLVGALGDVLVRDGIVRLAEASPHAYRYLFTWESDLLGRPAAFHAVDLPFLWDPDGSGRWSRFLGTRPRDGALTEAVQEAWTSFAATGRPMTRGEEWPPYRTGDRLTYELGDRIGVVRDPDGPLRRLWSKDRNDRLE